MSQTARNGNRTSGIAASRWAIATWVVGMVGVVGYPAQAIPLGNNTEEACAALLKQDLPPSAIGLPSGTAAIESAAIVAAVPFAVAERGPTPGARITPATPSFCKVLGHIKPIDPKAPNINFQINLPLDWNGRSVQYGGGGFNGVLITGLGLPPAHPFDKPSPLAQGMGPILATRQSRARSRRPSPPTTRPSQTSRIGPTRKCAMWP
jgi:Tannase and feruloyl esterase